MDGFGPVVMTTCSFECEQNCFQKVYRRPIGMILSDCQALVQVLVGHLSVTFSDSMMAVEELRTPGTKILAQWIPSHAGVRGNKIANDLANRGRGEQQPSMFCVRARSWRMLVISLLQRTVISRCSFAAC